MSRSTISQPPVQVSALLLPDASRAAGARLHQIIWPVAAPRAIVCLAHGLNEHAGRYGHVAARLNAAGFAVYAIDHWGHGWSDGVPAYVPDFSVYLDGMAALLARVQGDWPGVPRLLLGHSMGGLIAANHLIAHQDAYVAAALSGPALAPATPPGRMLILISRLLSRLAPRMGVVPLNQSAVSRDPAVVAAYLADPLVCHRKIGARLGAELMDAMGAARAGAGRITLPLLIQHGAADVLAAPAGSQAFSDALGSADKRLTYYPGLFHEIYNEPEQEQVLDDLIGWYQDKLGAGQAK